MMTAVIRLLFNQSPFLKGNQRIPLEYGKTSDFAFREQKSYRFSRNLIKNEIVGTDFDHEKLKCGNQPRAIWLKTVLPLK